MFFCSSYVLKQLPAISNFCLMFTRHSLTKFFVLCCLVSGLAWRWWTRATPTWWANSSSTSCRRNASSWSQRRSAWNTRFGVNARSAPTWNRLCSETIYPTERWSLRSHVISVVLSFVSVNVSLIYIFVSTSLWSCACTRINLTIHCHCVIKHVPNVIYVIEGQDTVWQYCWMIIIDRIVKRLLVVISIRQRVRKVQKRFASLQIPFPLDFSVLALWIEYESSHWYIEFKKFLLCWHVARLTSSWRSRPYFCKWARSETENWMYT